MIDNDDQLFRDKFSIVHPNGARTSNDWKELKILNTY